MTKKTHPRLLLINDDGINAEGLKYLYRGLRNKADITIVAPITEKSGSGVSMTLTKPLKILSISWEDNVPAWSVTGTPADCVKLALNSILKEPPDLIVSGINRGSNAGRNVLYSGTIGAVIEGIFRDNLPGIAFSCSDYENPGYHKFYKYVFPIVRHFMEHTLPSGTLLNVNFPSGSCQDVKGFRLARQGMGFWTDNPDKRIHPEGIPYYWLGGKWKPHKEAPDSDVLLLEQGYVTAVPIHVNEMTDHNHIAAHRVRFEDLFDAFAEEDLSDINK